MNQTPAPFDFHGKARAEMIRRGFQPDFPRQVMAEVNAVKTPPAFAPGCLDLRNLLWSSIDNNDSRDLDQIEWAEKRPDGAIRVLVGIADVDGMVKKGSATDARASANATSVYTGGPVFSMLPERLSTDLTSLGPNEDRMAIVIETVVAADGQVTCAEAEVALVRNHAQLNYDSVGRWLRDGNGAPGEGVLPPGLNDQLLLQNEAAQRLQKFRKQHGSLTFGGVESIPIIVANKITGFAMVRENAARDIIESFMVAGNVAMASYLRAKNSLCVRRIVRTPKRWDRILAIAALLGTRLPAQPDPKALGDFLAAQKQDNPAHFPELSLAVLKSMGPGEYVVEHPGQEHEGHFGLAVSDYTHSTAPNRRYADLLMQRLLKASLAGMPAPYTEAELTALAAHCTERESAAQHVERFMKKVAAALLLGPQIGQLFDAIVTGVNTDGTYARLLTSPAEGRVIRGEKGLDVGNEIQVRLVSVDPNRGFIDLENVRRTVK